MFGKRMIGMMGVPVPGEFIMSDDPKISLHDWVKLQEYEIWINGDPMTVHCYSMNHALKLASNLSLTNDDVVKVLFL